MRKNIASALSVLCIFCATFSKAQNVDTIYFASGGIDSYVNSGSTSTNYGTDTSLLCFYDQGSPNKIYRTFLQADLSGIPTNAIVTSATINVYAQSVNNSASHPYWISRVTSSWTEGGLTWSNQPTTTSTNRVGLTHSQTSSTGWHSAQISHLVQHQVTTPAENYGYRLALQTESGTDNGVNYASTEHSNSSLRPYLIVAWEEPVIDTFYVNTDSYVYSGSTGTNYGSDTSMIVKWDAGVSNYAYRSFLSVDITSIPQSHTITNSVLHLYAEAVDNSANHPIYFSPVLDSWTEGGITWSNQPSVTAGNRGSLTHAETSSTGWHTVSLIPSTKVKLNNPYQDYGWSIHLQSESGATDNGIVYASSDDANTNHRPYLVITHEEPIEIGGYVTHCTNGNDDGIIEPVVDGGCHSYTSYTWSKLTSGSFSTIETGTYIADASVSGLSDGLYRLEVTDFLGGTGYQYFFVGEEGTTTNVSFYISNSTIRRSYTEDSQLFYDKSPVDSFITGASSSTLGSALGTSGDNRSLIQYYVNWDPSLEFTQADQALAYRGSGHYQTSTSDNDAWVSRITEYWQEDDATWGTRPDVTTDGRITIPATTTNGFETRNDTIDLLGFVPEWQENNGQSYGFEISLKNFSQPAQAILAYHSSDDAGHNLMVSYTVKNRIETSYTDSIDAGRILVNAPAAEQPYTYLLSYDSLPDLTVLWDNIKDSTDIDSTYFFEGKSFSRNYVFEDLPSNRYYVGVYDNNGDQILMREVIVSPSFEIFDSTDITVDEDTIEVKSGETDAEATLLARLPYGEDGGIEFEVVQLTNIVKFGFDNVEDAFPSFSRDYKYLVEIKTTGKVYLTRSDTLIDSTTVSIGDKLILTRETGVVYLYKNGVKECSDVVARWNNKDWKLNLELKGTAGKIKPLVAYGKFKLPKMKFVVEPLECGETEATVTFNLPANTYFGLSFSNYVIRDETNSIIASGSSVPGSLTLGVGIYTLYYQYTISPYSYSVYLGQVVVGYPIQWSWTSPTDNITLSTGTINTISPTLPSNPAQAIGLNECSAEPSLSNWVQFESKNSSATPMVFSDGSWQYAREEITLRLDGSTVYARVKIEEIGYGVISRYVKLYNGSTLESTYLSNSLNPFSLEFPTDGSGNYDFVELWQDGQLKGDFATNVDGIITVQANELGKVLIQNTIASFCGENKIQHYADVTKKLDGGYYLARKGNVKFIYKEEYKDLDANLTFNVYDDQNQVVISNLTLAELVAYGDNRYELDFSCSGINNLNDGIYVLEVVNEKNEKWYLRFKVINNC